MAEYEDQTGEELRATLDDKTVDELEEIASEREIEGRSSMNKADLVEAIATDVESDDEDTDEQTDEGDPEVVTTPGEGDPDSTSEDHQSAATLQADDEDGDSFMSRPRFTAEPEPDESGPNSPPEKATRYWQQDDEDVDAATAGEAVEETE